MYKDCGCIALKNIYHIVFRNLGLTLHDNLVTLYGNNFACILVNEVLVPALKHTRCESLAENLFEVTLIDLHLLGKVENLEDILICLESDGTEEGCNRQLLLAVDVGIHHVVNVGRKLYPRALEWDDTCGIEQCSVGVYALAKEHAWRTVQL